MVMDASQLRRLPELFFLNKTSSAIQEPTNLNKMMVRVEYALKYQKIKLVFTTKC